MNDLQAALSTYRYYGVGHDYSKTKGEYSAILYRPARFDLLKNDTFWLSETPTVAARKGWDANTIRICRWIQIRANQNCRWTYITGNTDWDLNETSSSDVYPTIIMKTAFKDAKTLSETPHCGANGTLSTFNVTSKMGNRIDYIFVTSHFKVLQHGALTDSNNGFYPSNYLLVLTEVAIKTTKSN